MAVNFLTLGNTKLSKEMQFTTSYFKSFCVDKSLVGLSFKPLYATHPNQLSHKAH